MKKNVPVLTVADSEEAANLAGLPLEATVALADLADAIKEGLLGFRSMSRRHREVERDVVERCLGRLVVRHAAGGAGVLGGRHLGGREPAAEPTRSRSNPRRGPGWPEDILAHRYASGEIDDEYRHRLDTLRAPGAWKASHDLHHRHHAHAGSARVPPRRPRRRGLVAGLAVGVIAFAFALARADGGAELQASATQQVAAGRQACQQWLDDGTASQGAGPGAGWCDEMVRWMTDNMANGQMMMAP